MKVSQNFYALLLLNLCIATFQTTSTTQTSWNVTSTVEANALTRVSYYNDAFHLAWQDANSWNDLINHEVAEYTGSQELPLQFQATGHQIDDFKLSNLAFESDGTPIFTGSSDWEDHAHYAYDTSDHVEYTAQDFGYWLYNGGANIRTSSMVYGAGVYVASFSDSKSYSYYESTQYSLASSSDLQNWTYASLPTGYSVENVIYENGRFLAIGSYKNPNTWSNIVYGAILTSLSGNFWTATILPTQGRLQDVTFTGSEWLAVGDNTSFWRSLDGHTWVEIQPSNLDGDLTAVASGNGYTIVGTASGALFSTVDNVNFIQQAQYSGRVNDIAVGADLFMAAIGPFYVESEFSPIGIADITSHPTNAYTIPDERVTLSVQAGGNGPLSYQWYIGNSGDTSTPIAGAVASTYETSPLTQTGRYWVRVENPLGSEDSLTATLTMQNSPTISSQPEAQQLNMGETTTSRVSATGNNLSYQWYEGLSGDTTQPISGRTSSYFGLRTQQPGTFHYWARVSNDLGSVDSITIQVVVIPIPPKITDQPQDATITVNGFFGSNVYVQAVGPTLSYQWYEGFSGDTSAPISSSTYWSFNPSDDNVGVFYYWVRVSNAAGYIDSRTVTYTVLPMLPVIEEQPLDQWITEEQSVTLRIDVDYRSNTTYQWFEGDTGNPVDASSSSSYKSLSSLAVGSHTYWVRVTNPDGYTDSREVTVHVSPTSYTSWLTREGLSSNESGDGVPERSIVGDGFPNLVRYLIGANSHENLSNTKSYSHGTIEIGNDVYATLQFTTLKDVSDATLHIEESADLATWTETATLVSALDNGDGTVTYVYRTSGTHSTDRGYLRLRGSKP